MRRGFTLIEIMIAVLVISLGVIPVYMLLTSGTRGSTLRDQTDQSSESL